MPAAPLTKRELDRHCIAGCSTPGCTHEDHGTLFLHGACHKGGPIEVSYRIGTGVLHVGCKVCKKTIVDVAVQGILGATGEPATSETPGDKGGLRAMMVIEGERIRLDFGKELSWVSMTADEAKQLAAELLKRAELIQGGK